jgi:hypothetical protein
MTPVDRRVRGGIALLVVIGLVAAGVIALRPREPARDGPVVVLTRAEQERQRLFEEIQPVQLANCELERFGEERDGGYLLCANLLGEVKAAYSYGISGYDKWGVRRLIERLLQPHGARLQAGRYGVPRRVHR